MTTRSPRAIAARASRIPGSRLTGSAQSTTVAMVMIVTPRPGFMAAPLRRFAALSGPR